jgi:hypothetical protein
MDGIWLTTNEAAELVGRAVGTLANWRSQGKGPDYYHIQTGGPVSYKRIELEAWIESRRRHKREEKSDEKGV